MHKITIQKDKEYGWDIATFEICADSILSDYRYVFASILLFLTFWESQIPKILKEFDN